MAIHFKIDSSELNLCNTYTISYASWQGDYYATVLSFFTTRVATTNNDN